MLEALADAPTVVHLLACGRPLSLLLRADGSHCQPSRRVHERRLGLCRPRAKSEFIGAPVALAKLRPTCDTCVSPPLRLLGRHRYFI
eukprot:scaffold343_cov584-Prasinococcus_capsulatus_cf.AAC.4